MNEKKNETMSTNSIRSLKKVFALTSNFLFLACCDGKKKRVKEKVLYM
jgi:hypothetical protein